jgi:TonB family protein
MSYLEEETYNPKDRYKGLIGTLLIHGILIILFFILGLTAPESPPFEKGVVVDLGTAEMGQGQQTQATQQVQSQSTSASSQQEAQEEVMTQDYQEAPAIEEEQNQTQEQTTQEETNPTSNTQNQPAEEDQQEQQQEQEEERQVNEDALYSGNQSEQNNQGEGNQEGNQDQGQPDGQTGGSTVGGDQMGAGDAGIGFSLEGRSLVQAPNIKDQSQKTGKVLINIKVDQDGNVISVDFSLKGSTTSDPHLVKLAKKAARQTKFNPDAGAPNVQYGSITFNFKVR